MEQAGEDSGAAEGGIEHNPTFTSRVVSVSPASAIAWLEECLLIKGRTSFGPSSASAVGCAALHRSTGRPRSALDLHHTLSRPRRSVSTFLSFSSLDTADCERMHPDFSDRPAAPANRAVVDGAELILVEPPNGPFQARLSPSSSLNPLKSPTAGFSTPLQTASSCGLSGGQYKRAEGGPSSLTRGLLVSPPLTDGTSCSSPPICTTFKAMPSRRSLVASSSR